MVLVPRHAQDGDSTEGARSAFWIDTTPVTNAEYHRFVADTGHPSPAHWTGRSFPPELRDHPVAHVTHTDAATYATWAGKYLPSVKEWEVAISGRHGGAFPWGATGTAMKCNVRESGIGHTTAVLTYHSGISDHGVYDLSGSDWEWCRTPTGPGAIRAQGQRLHLTAGHGCRLPDQRRPRHHAGRRHRLPLGVPWMARTPQNRVVRSIERGDF